MREEVFGGASNGHGRNLLGVKLGRVYMFKYVDLYGHSSMTTIHKNGAIHFSQ